MERERELEEGGRQPRRRVLGFRFRGWLFGLLVGGRQMSHVVHFDWFGVRGSGCMCAGVCADRYSSQFEDTYFT